VADLTKAQLSARVLEHLGVKSAANAANAHDDEFVQEAIDAAHERLRKYGLVPFATSAVPPWAQTQLRDYVAGDVAQAFGMSGQRLVEFKQTSASAERELARQVAGYRHNLPIVTDYF
jgi:hypothetical protein